MSEARDAVAEVERIGGVRKASCIDERRTYESLTSLLINESPLFQQHFHSSLYAKLMLVTIILSNLLT
ncbi:hypothetical protein PROFUN_02364 [Planoprotostelium fungivorum]|uniref:GSKIP domain-containing protein n=1 Tax=Planoprotostelium fungivorum TaxID=1890364 RepID=A0A2P6NUK8_9EUKA|nr:hypothetical protein PROFUN_02351 [Planoprotostelium fungivorum]PRP87664.1 hypothetical protein PROFUN_02364 [Planoprotostelium fungivorum]